MNLPDWLYEALPYIYFVVGALALIETDPTFGQISGALLIAAAAWIMRLRHLYRREWQ